MQCPSLAQLRLLLKEQLSPETFQAIESHIEGCENCKENLRQLLIKGETLGEVTALQDIHAMRLPSDTSTMPGVQSTRATRYRIKGFHAGGGLGEVFKAVDPELNREVALKCIQARFQNDADSRRRFLQEAEITGRLEHPGVVPVYGMDHDVAGVPSYAMRFIRGETLDEAVKRFHQAEKPGRDPGERSLSFRELLGRFVAVCNTVAYAHSRGILHRDLKPGNVMLDKYNQTLVVDWGLAKPIERDETARACGEETLSPVSASGDSATQAGKAMGTPAYMSPEQAAGDWDTVGPASDIYSLGATLYVLLTGQAPFKGRDFPEIQRKIQSADFPKPRQVNKACPPALEAVCLKAMAIKREDRYTTALALAEDVEHWLADEPVGAWREPLPVRARRWVRRNRTLAMAATTAMILLLLAAGVTFALVQQHRREQQEQTSQMVNQALGQAMALRDQARTLAAGDLEKQKSRVQLWSQCVEAAKQAKTAVSSGNADADTRKHVEDAIVDLLAESDNAKKDRRMLEQLEDARDKILKFEESDWIRLQNSDKVSWVGAAAAPAYAKAFHEYGIDVETISTEEAAKSISQRSIWDHLCTALDTWYFVAPDAAGGRLLDVARVADPDPLRSRVRAAIAKKDRNELKQLADSENAIELPPATLALLTRVLYHNDLRAEGLDLIKRGQAKYSSDYWINLQLGNVLSSFAPLDYPRAGRCFATAIALKPNNEVAWQNLGNVLLNEGHLDAAVSAFHNAIRINKDSLHSYSALSQTLIAKGELAKAHIVVDEALNRWPNSVLMLMARGSVLSGQGEFGESNKTYQRLLDRYPDLIVAKLLLALGRCQTKEYDEAIQLVAEVQKLHPTSPLINFALGPVLSDRGDWVGAEDAYDLAIKSGFVAPIVWTNRGLVRSKQGRYAEGLEDCRKAVRIAPANSDYRGLLAGALLIRGDVEEAIATAREAIQLNPANAQAYSTLGHALLMKQKYDEATLAFKKAVEFRPRNAQYHAGLADSLRNLKDFDGALAEINNAILIDTKQATIHHTRGSIYRDQKLYVEAINSFKHAIDLDPLNATHHVALALAQMADKNKISDGIAELSKAAELNPRSGSVQLKLSEAYRRVENYQEAIEAGRKAVELIPEDANAHNNLALALENQGHALQNHKHLEDALAEYREAIRLAPKNATLHMTLGLALHKRKLYGEAIVSFREAIWLDKNNAKYHNYLGLALFNEKKYTEAAEAFDKAVILDHTIADYHNNLAIIYHIWGDALFLEKNYPEAAIKFRKAVDLNRNNYDFHIALANTLYHDHNYKEAESEAHRAIKIDPDRPKAYNLLGQVYFKQHMYAEAVPHYRDAVSRSKTDPILHANLGNVLRLNGDIPEAIEVLKRAADLHPKSITVQSNLCLALRDAKKYSEAISAGQKAIQFAPEDADHHNNLAMVFEDNEQLDNAISEYRKAVLLAPKDAALHRNLAAAMFQNKQYHEAIAWFREAIELDRKDKANQIVLAGDLAKIGLVLMKSEMYKEAEPVLRECLTIRAVKQAEYWGTFSVRSMLGGSLLGQKKTDEEVEKLLLEGYKGMKAREDAIPRVGKPRLIESLERLVQFYEARDQKDKVVEWRKKLEEQKKLNK